MAIDRRSAESLRESLLDKTDDELFELLHDTTLARLKAEFIADYLDCDDRETYVFALLRGDASDELKRGLRENWSNFLRNRNLLNRYHDEIETKTLGDS